MFQHFRYPGVLRNQIEQTCVNLANEKILAYLAQQFGALGASVRKPASGRPEHDGARHAIEPHDRGTILCCGCVPRLFQGLPRTERYFHADHDIYPEDPWTVGTDA